MFSIEIYFYFYFHKQIKYAYKIYKKSVNIFHTNLVCNKCEAITIAILLNNVKGHFINQCY